MITPQEILKMEGDIVQMLKSVYDPEIPVNVYDLGLIYQVDVSPDGTADILMTLTAPNCPMADQLFENVRERTSEVNGITSVNVEFTFDPPWDKSMLSDEARLELGFL